jgi:hypothetical protein
MSYEEKVKSNFICPISGIIMNNPVEASDGYIYEKTEITKFIEEFGMSPVTFKELKKKTLTPQNDLKKQINKYLSNFPDERSV